MIYVKERQNCLSRVSVLLPLQAFGVVVNLLCSALLSMSCCRLVSREKESCLWVLMTSD